MDHQKIMNGATNTAAQPNGLIEGIGTFGADLAALAVLQARLAASDLREGVKRARLALAVVLICGMVSASGTVAIILGASLWLAARFEIQQGTAMMLAGMACLFAAAAIAFFCVRAMISKESVFQRSHEELERNLAWIRTTLMQSGR